MLFLSTLKGITRDGSLETIAEVAHPGAGGDASEVCNRYQDVIGNSPEGDRLRARYAQVLFILDNQVRSQLEFPPPSSGPLEVTAASTGSGEGDLSGEGGAGDSGESETTFQGAPPQGEDANGEQGSTQLPGTAQAGTGEGDLPGDQATDSELPLANPPTGESTPGSMTPRGRNRR